MTNKSRWSSRIHFILTTTGAAVGLGSIWKFPYMTGNNGGGAFILVLMLSTALIGLPIMIGEIMLGRIGQANPITALKKLALDNSHSSYWQLLGWWGALGLLLVLSFYSVIAGWSIAYTFKTWTGQLSTLSASQLSEFFQGFLSNPWELLFWHSIFIFMTLWVVTQGVQAGIEKASKFMMPALLLIHIILVSYSAYIGDLTQTFSFFFKHDFSKLTPTVMIEALGQSVFSLAVGAGCMLTFGCYITENIRIGFTVCIIAALILLISLLSGLAIFPLVFAFALAPDDGPGLMFKVLPIAFNQMPFGTAFGGLFFLMLWFAAWTSSISMAEPLVIILQEKYQYTRLKSAIIIGIIAWILGSLAMLSFNCLENIQLFNRYTLFEAIVGLTTNIILPIGALGFSIFAGWLLPANIAKDTLQMQPIFFTIWQCLIRFIAPIGIIVIMLV